MHHQSDGKRGKIPCRTSSRRLPVVEESMKDARMATPVSFRARVSSCCSFVVFLAVCLLALLNVTTSAAHQEETKHQCVAQDGGGGDGSSTCKASDLGSDKEEESHDYSKCGLYMAESSIPNAGWGMFTGRKMRKGEYHFPLDVVVDVYDHVRHNDETMNAASGKLGGSGATPFGVDVNSTDLPLWLMQHYEWEGFEVGSQFSANFVRCILPGVGMLANSHTALFNAWDHGSMETVWSSGSFVRKGNETLVRSRRTPSTGAYSHVHSLTFETMEDLQAGQEIFAEYGDNYFEDRAAVMGDLPLSFDFEIADRFLQKWLNVTGSTKVTTKQAIATELWDLTVDLTFEVWNGDDFVEKKRLRNALPSTGEEAWDWCQRWPNRTTAQASVPNLVRPVEWLDENAYCLDNIRPDHVKDEQAGNENDNNTTKVGISKGKGAFAVRFLEKGSVVSPAPVVHLSRDHLKMHWIEPQSNKVASVLWEGDQMLLNYCYGHPQSSLLFFPYSSAVNLINHGRPANVALRWASKDKMPNPEMLNWTSQEMINNTDHVGLMMEIYALRDIEEGEEVLLDYGDAWEKNWNKHVEEWVAPVLVDDYKTPAFYSNLEKLPTAKDKNEPLPAYIQTRCWAEVDGRGSVDGDGFYDSILIDSDDIDNTVPCRVLELQADSTDDVHYYKVELEKRRIRIKDVPKSRITYVDREYTNDQHLRQGFRHEIQLPDEMVPRNWKDLVAAPPQPSADNEDTSSESSCGLYMAESAIPGSGLGMFTARALSENERIFYGEVVIPVDDIDVNLKLRHWIKGEFEYDIKDDNDWIMDTYHWNSLMTNIQFEAGNVQSAIPGLGMLANSHTGLVNARLVAPKQTTDLHRGQNPGAGSSTTYHDQHFMASRDLEAGAELYVDYTDGYFVDIEGLEAVAFSTDFIKADEILEEFQAETGGDFESEKARKAWDQVLSTHAENVRLTSALPKTLDDIPRVLEIGAAEYSVPNRVRSIEWLEKNGKCLDNIRPARSKNWEAGQGAFATRTIHKGDVVAPVPVVQMHRKHMEGFDSDDVYDPEVPVRRDGLQLIMNYCFGHNESNLLLFPYSPVVNYINHNATEYNAKLQWSFDLPNQNKEWFELSPNQVVKQSHAGLIMELVATREIDLGEEILIHYGDLWENAWNDHVAHWEHENGKSYVSAAQLNKHVHWLRTIEEEKTDPYPENVHTGCFLSRRVLMEHSVNPRRAVKWKYSDRMYETGHNVRPCGVVSRTSNEDPNLIQARRDSNRPINIKYTVVVELDYENEEQMESGQPPPSFLVTDVPRKAIRFYDHMYSSDQFLRTAFRHEIQLPDDMVPPAWRDRIEE